MSESEDGSDANDPAARPISVLHVADDPELATLTASSLEQERERIVVETAAGAREGFEVLASSRVDCIVSRYEMSGQNGVEFLEAVREEYPALPFILYTDSGSEAAAAAAISAGVTDYVREGSGADQRALLADRITDAVDRHRSRQVPEHHQELQRHTHTDDRTGELERTNALLSALFDALPYGLLAVHEARDTVAINQRMVDLLGVAGSQRGRTVADRADVAERLSDASDGSGPLLEELDDLCDTPPAKDDGELVRADGKTFERQYRPVGLPDGDGHLWVYEDVTEYIEQERRLEALHQATQELLSAESCEEVAEIGVEVAKDVLDLDANGIYLYDDDESALVLGAATEDVYDLVGEPPTFTPGTSIAWRVYEQGEPTALDNVRDDQAIHNPDTPIHSELLVPIGDEGVLIAGSPTPEAFDERHVLLGEILTRNIATALEHVEQIEELQMREEELTRQNERLNQFASVVSHDLRNPLNVASARLELLARECDSDHLDSVQKAHARMETLIDDLLTLAREDEAVTDPQPVDLTTLVEDCWRNVETADAALDVDTERLVQADASRLKQLFENLFRNAVEHGGEGVTVTIGELDDGFYVEDDGPGLSEADTESVFEAGYSTSESGTGFGLSIVEQVAQAHGWSVSATNGSGGGARFEISDVDFDPG